MKLSDNYKEIAQKLIAIPSVTKDIAACNAALEFVKSRLSKYSVKTFEKDNRKSLLFSNQPFPVKTFTVLLNAHVDVVAGKADQFVPIIKQNRLYGRGALDMKSAAACFISLFQEVGSQISFPLGLQIVTDEEIGGFCGTGYQIEQGVNAKFVLCGESTDLALNNQAKGVITLRVDAKGTTGHSAYPWKAKNALWKMVSFLEQVKKQFPEAIKEEWKTTVNLATIETTNKTLNTVPDFCSCFLDIRFIPGDEEKCIDCITLSLLEGMSIEILLKEPAHKVDTQNNYFHLLEKSINKTTSKKAHTVKKHGASDARHFSKVGIASVVFGPSGEGIHSDTEYVNLDSLETYTEIVKQFLFDCEKNI